MHIPCEVFCIVMPGKRDATGHDATHFNTFETGKQCPVRENVRTDAKSGTNPHYHPTYTILIDGFYPRL